MRMFIQHNDQGDIISVAQMDALWDDQDSPFLESEDPSISVFEVTDLAEFAGLEPIDIHEGYQVDVANRKLVKKV